MISCASTNAMIRVLKNSQTLRPIFRQFGFRKVSTFAYHSVPVDVSQFAPAVADTSQSLVSIFLIRPHRRGGRMRTLDGGPEGRLRSDSVTGPLCPKFSSCLLVRSVGSIGVRPDDPRRRDP